jgi:hypothetical protein
MQYVDWSMLRLSDPRSSEWRQAVNLIVERLVQIEEALTPVQIENDEQEASEEVDTEGLYDVIAEIEKHLPAWHEAVLSHQGTHEQLLAASGTYMRQLSRASGPSARHAALIRYGEAVRPLVERSIGDGREYSAKSIALDTYIVKLIRLAVGSAEARVALAQVYDAIRDGIEGARENSDDPALRRSGSFRRESSRSKKFGELARMQEQKERYSDEGNSIVLRWDREIGNLLSAQV